ncbi:MAG: PQQ-binding-like beta-propeller repeat protein [Phycisphaerales bacterium]
MHKGDEQRTQVALFGVKPAGQKDKTAESPLTELWFSQMGRDTWTLVRTDKRGALFFVGEQNGGRLVRVDADGGKVAWQTEPFGAMFPTDPPAKFGGQVDPQQSKMLLRERVFTGAEPRQSEIIIATDDRTVCMVERAGRCAAVDGDTGQVLWTSRLPLTRIADATVSGGQLVVAGEFPQPQADNKIDRLGLFDARTGAQSAVNAAPISGVRYIRTTSRGDLILGAQGAIAAVSAVDLETAKASWTLSGHPAANAFEAWLLDDRLFLMSDSRTLWEVSAVSGGTPSRPIDVQGRLEARTPVAVWQAGDGVVAFATGRGLALIDSKGSLRQPTR